jgi:TolA-binding protein
VRAETRRQLKEDRFSRATLGAAEKTVHWTVEHKSKLTTAVVAAVVIVGAALGSWYYLDRQNERASMDLTQAVRTLGTPIVPAGTPAQPDVTTFSSVRERAAAATKQLQTIVDKYPHTHTADVARYLLGTTAMDLGDKATAERQLKEVTASRPSDLASLAKLALANLYASDNRTKNAGDLYKELIDKPTETVSKATAQLALAQLYENSQQPQEAKRIYEQIRKENPSGDAASLAQSKLQQLK